MAVQLWQKSFIVIIPDDSFHLPLLVPTSHVPSFSVCQYIQFLPLEGPRTRNGWLRFSVTRLGIFSLLGKKILKRSPNILVNLRAILNNITFK